MIKKFFKSSIAILLAIALVLLPGSFTEAKAADVLTQSQVTDQSNTVKSLATDKTKYEEAGKQAELKAKMLTSIYGVTSVQYALIDDGEVVLSGHSGVYEKDNKTELTKDHMYGIGSVSKMFTTVAVMQLVDEGKVKLDEPVTTYIPEFKMADARYKKITVRMLLNHSSGLMGSTYNNASLFEDNDFDYLNYLLTTLSTQRLKADPGEFSVYCNDGFSLAELLVEKVSGLSFTEYITKNISSPLNLNNTKTPMDTFNRDQLVKTYVSGNVALPVEDLLVLGAGGIYSTAEDLCHFGELFVEESDAKLLSATSTKAMANSEYLNGLWWDNTASSLTYGLGWDNVNTYPFNEYGIKALVKGGDTSFYHGSLVVLPDEGMSMAVLTSGGSSIYTQVFAQEILLDVLLAKGSIKEIKDNAAFTQPIAATMPDELKEFAGYYANGGGVFIIDISEDGILKLCTSETAPESSAQKFIYTDNGKFYSLDGSAYVSFEKGSNGNMYLYVDAFGVLPNLGVTRESDYQAQKIYDNPIPLKLKKVWEARENKRYLTVNEKYSSQLYAFSTPTAAGILLKGIEGYFYNAAIIDENKAEMQVKLPGLYGRDLYDLIFYTEGKTEYLKVGGGIYVSLDSLKTISTKSSFNVTLDSKGYAKWFKLGTNAKGRKIKVTLPKKSSFSVYSADGLCTFSTITANQSAVELPSGGYIVFAGSAGAKFNVKYVK